MNNKVLLTTISAIILLSLIPYSFADDFSIIVSNETPIVGELIIIKCLPGSSMYPYSIFLEVIDGSDITTLEEISNGDYLYEPLNTNPLEISCVYTHPDGDFERSDIVTPIDLPVSVTDCKDDEYLSEGECLPDLVCEDGYTFYKGEEECHPDFEPVAECPDGEVFSNENEVCKPIELMCISSSAVWDIATNQCELEYLVCGGDLTLYDYTTGICSEPDGTDVLPKKSGGSSNEWKTKPTFGLSHQTFLPLVDGGFTFNGMTHDITDNWHTDFPIQSVTLGIQNTFEARVYAEKNLMVQEFLFGIPEAGKSHDAELGVEIWYDYDGNIEDIVIVQETDVIDVNSVNVIHSMVKCQASDNDENCHSTILSMTFLEPLFHDVMAIKAIDFKHRDHITYLNEGFDISGISLNPMISLFISGTEKHEGLIEITQTAKYSDLWIAEDGREFNVNEAGSFKWINHVFERFADSGEPRTRSHSAFTDLIVQQQNIAQQTINEKYGSIESVSRDGMISQSKLIISNIEELQNLDELSTTCTALHMDYDAQVWLQAEYPYIKQDKNTHLFVDNILDGFPLISLKAAVNSCDNTLAILES